MIRINKWDFFACFVCCWEAVVFCARKSKQKQIKEQLKEKNIYIWKKRKQNKNEEPKQLEQQEYNKKGVIYYNGKKKN